MGCIVDSNIRLLIDVDKKEIRQNEEMPLLVCGEHNSTRVSFVCDKVINGHDISEGIAKVNYYNYGKKRNEITIGVYEADDLIVDEDEVNFSWLISGNATKFEGTLCFTVNFECVSNGEINYLWSTQVFKNFYVQEGIRGEEKIEELYPDLLEKYKDDIRKSIDFSDIKNMPNFVRTIGDISSTNDNINPVYFEMASSVYGYSYYKIKDIFDLYCKGIAVQMRNDLNGSTLRSTVLSCSQVGNDFRFLWIEEVGIIILTISFDQNKENKTLSAKIIPFSWNDINV